MTVEDWVGLSGGGVDGFECDVVAESFELFDQASDVGLVVVALHEPVAAEVVVGLAAIENVVGGHEDGMANGDSGALLAASAGEPPELRGQVGVFGLRGGVGGLGQRAAQPL